MKILIALISTSLVLALAVIVLQRAGAQDQTMSDRDRLRSLYQSLASPHPRFSNETHRFPC